nr:uncharacterized protein LOC117223770 isoform X2 [Megalopta genalis]
MTFVYTLYILIIVFAENKLIKATYEIIPEKIEHDRTNYKVLSEDLNCSSTISSVYFLDLIQWTKHYPMGKISKERSTMELTRKLLGYPDIVKYIKENRRPVNLLDLEDYHLANVLEFPEHKVVRRYASKNDKHSSVRRKKGKKKRAHKEHSEDSMKQKKRNHGAASMGYHAVTHKNHKLKKKENKFNRTTCYLQKHQSLCISIVFVLVFIILILVAAYYLHKRSRLKARGTRFNWVEHKEDKDTLTDYIEWNDEAVCTCSDVHIGSTRKCPLCNRIYQTTSHISKKCLSCMSVKKSTDKSKKKRFSFLQKCLQDKKKGKNLENLDWKCVKRKNIEKYSIKFLEK